MYLLVLAVLIALLMIVRAERRRLRQVRLLVQLYDEMSNLALEFADAAPDQDGEWMRVSVENARRRNLRDMVRVARLTREDLTY